MKSDERDELVPLSELKADEVPAGIDRRAFMMRTAMVGATAVLTRCASPATGTAAPPPTPPQIPAGAVSPDLDVKKKTKGPVMTVIDEFYKVGPGPSSSHTIGPMRITYDFYQRAAKLPADKLAKATKLQVNLFGSHRARDGTRDRESGVVAGRGKTDGAGGSSILRASKRDTHAT